MGVTSKAFVSTYGADGTLTAELIEQELPDPTGHEVLVRVAGEVGLNPDAARELLASDRYATEVREREQFYQQQGIHSVPAIIINDRHLISGGQPVEVFEQALRQIAAQG